MLVSKNPPSVRQASSASQAKLNPWVFAVLTDTQLTPNAVSVALYFRDTTDMQAGFTSPSFRSIAQTTGLSRGSAERAVRMLASTGHVQMIAGGGGFNNANIYKLAGGRI
ncbi:hypothetical protein CO675_19810 [Bradyrhizobium sp. C9]|nr:hypothetical protein CO675_19810 [Bradyrhizobium sp. C9]